MMGMTETPYSQSQALRGLPEERVRHGHRGERQGTYSSTADAMRIYDEMQPGTNYADTSTKEDNAWTLLCRGFGTSKPKTDYGRLMFLLDVSSLALRAVSATRKHQSKADTAAAGHREDPAADERALRRNCSDGRGHCLRPRRSRGTNGTGRRAHQRQRQQHQHDASLPDWWAVYYILRACVTKTSP